MESILIWFWEFLSSLLQFFIITAFLQPRHRISLHESNDLKKLKKTAFLQTLAFTCVFIVLPRGYLCFSLIGI